MCDKICKKCKSIKEVTTYGILLCRKCKNDNAKRYALLDKINGVKRIKKYPLKFYNIDIFKSCKICNVSKSIIYFTKKHDGKYGVKTICKSCEKLIRDTDKNDPLLLEVRRNYNRKYKNKYKRNPLYLLKASLRKRIYVWCKEHLSIKRSKKTVEILGISFNNFKIYIEKQFDKNMNWSNYGSYWHIDHIKPLSLAKTEEDMILLNHYTNLRPLEAIENLKKHAKYQI